MKRHRLLLALTLPVLVAVGCEIQKSENPLSPTIAGPIPGVEISAPRLLEPAAGAQIPGDRQPLTLLIENASSNGPRPLNYVFEVASDAGFANKVFSRDAVEPGTGGRTSLRLPDALGMGRIYYWRAKAQDGANTGPYSAPVDFNVFTPVSFDRPNPISPANNEKLTDLVPEFRLGNAPHAGNPGNVTYTIEVATGDSFANVLVAWQFNEQVGGETKFKAITGFPPGLQLFWRVRASAAAAIGPWSGTAVFRTPTPVVVPPPTGPDPGAPCYQATSHLGVVECRRKQYNHMSQAEANQFLRGVARDLNLGNFAGGPFGIYPKATGNQCLGYSCDIICAPQGGAWDVLLDFEGDQTPIWGFKGNNPNPTCEVQR